jgi:hypothetical protein
MAKPELFTVTFWEVASAQIVHSAAGGALTALTLKGVGESEPGTLMNIPWWGLAVGAVTGGLTALLLALSGKVNPNSPPGALMNVPGQSPPEQR